MARLIDADELLSEYQTICSSIRCYDCQFNGEWGDKGCQLEALIKDAPTIDPVEHGHWIWNEDEWNHQCSVCKERFDYSKTYELFDHGFQMANYCPNCGAKMEEEPELL